MLKAFTLRNYKNFKDEITIDFENIRDYLFQKDCISDGIITKMLICGRNATGKTNLGKALLDVKDVLYGTFECPYDPFLLNADSDEKTAFFEYRFQFGDTELCYEYLKEYRGLAYEKSLKKRVKVSFHVSEVFQPYFDGSWSFGTGKLVSLKGRWYFHIPMTKTTPDTFDRTNPEQLIGIDRGLRFLAVTYDEQEKSHFINGKDLMKKRDTFANVRAELQSKGSRSAKRALKRISGRENRWMTDVNHQITKTLVTEYGPETLFVLEDLKGVSFEEENLSKRSKTQRRQTRSWAFYQLEQLFTYKAKEIGADVIKVSPAYTSQRCPKCGRIHKENRHREIHEYICDVCGYRSNDDRVGAINLFELGLRYVSGDRYPSFKIEEH